MARARQIFRHPFALILAASVVIWVLLALLAPGVAAELTTHEGPIEQLDHVILAVLLVVWAWLAVETLRRRRYASRATKVLAVFMWFYLVFLALEEIDWGMVYGIDLGYSLLVEWIGSPNLHPPPQGGSLFEWALVWSALPLMAFFAASLVPFAWFRERWERTRPLRPEPLEAAWFLVAAVMSLVMDSIPLVAAVLPAGEALPDASEPSPLCLFQAVLFLLVLLVAVRALRAIRAPDSGEETG